MTLVHNIKGIVNFVRNDVVLCADFSGGIHFSCKGPVCELSPNKVPKIVRLLSDGIVTLKKSVLFQHVQSFCSRVILILLEA